MFKEKIFRNQIKNLLLYFAMTGKVPTRNQIKNLLLYFAMTGKVPTFAPAFGNEAVLIERLTD